MMDIKEIITSQIKDNDVQAITAKVMRAVLFAMVDAMDASSYLLDVTSEFGYRGDFQGALAAAVAGVRTSAVILSFLNDDNVREMWQLNGGEFPDVNNWQQFGGIEGMTDAEIDELLETILTNK